MLVYIFPPLLPLKHKFPIPTSHIIPSLIINLQDERGECRESQILARTAGNRREDGWRRRLSNLRVFKLEWHHVAQPRCSEWGLNTGSAAKTPLSFTSRARRPLNDSYSDTYLTKGAGMFKLRAVCVHKAGFASQRMEWTHWLLFLKQKKTFLSLIALAQPHLKDIKAAIN